VGGGGTAERIEGAALRGLRELLDDVDGEHEILRCAQNDVGGGPLIDSAPFDFAQGRLWVGQRRINFL
jgi:hypothetical protein